MFRRARPREASISSRESSQAAPPPPASAALIKVALVGDSQVGKTSLMVRYVEGAFDETQLPTQGVNFMEKTVSMGREDSSHDVTFSIGHSCSVLAQIFIRNNTVLRSICLSFYTTESIVSVSSSVCFC